MNDLGSPWCVARGGVHRTVRGLRLEPCQFGAGGVEYLVAGRLSLDDVVIRATLDSVAGKHIGIVVGGSVTTAEIEVSAVRKKKRKIVNIPYTKRNKFNAKYRSYEPWPWHWRFVGGPFDGQEGGQDANFMVCYVGATLAPTVRTVSSNGLETVYEEAEYRCTGSEGFGSRKVWVYKFDRLKLHAISWDSSS